MIPIIYKYIEYIKDSDVLSSTFIIIFASLMNSIIKKFTDEIIIPFSKSEELKININEYILLIINTVIITFILYLFIYYQQ